MSGQPGFFDVDERLRRLSGLGDQLEAFAAAVDFELLRPVLDAALDYSDGSKGGRPPLDAVMMFKVLVIQAANGLSDERAEYLINDRLSFMRFLGLGLGDRVPDARTIWLFRERLTHAGVDGRPAIEVLFARSTRRSGRPATWSCPAAPQCGDARRQPGVPGHNRAVACRPLRSSSEAGEARGQPGPPALRAGSVGRLV